MSKSKRNRQQPQAVRAAPLPRPDSREIAVAHVSDKYSEYPSNGLTPVRLAEIFREADAGDVMRQMELFEEMEEKDPHLFSQLQTRKNAVTGLDYEVIPFGDDPRDKEIADFIGEQLGTIESFEDVETDLLDAVGKGFAVSEIMWGYDEGHVVVQEIRSRQQKRFFWDSLDDTFKVRTQEHSEGLLLPRNKFIVHRYKARSGHPSRAGVLRVTAWMYLFKNYDLKDWVSFCEVFGMPLRLGKYTAAASEADQRALMEAIYSLGTDAAGIIPDSTMIEFIESNKTTSVEIYEKLARYCDEQISKAILGQTLSSDSGGGSYAQGKVHNEVRHDLTAADAKALATTIRRDIIKPLVEYNFGYDVDAPLFTFASEETEDLKDTVTIYQTLNAMGLPISTEHIYNKFNIPKPEKGEELLKAPVSGQMTLPYPDMEQKSLKDMPEQEQIDILTDEARKQTEQIFQKMMEPVLKMVDKYESLDALQMALKNADTLKEVYREMDSPDLEDIMHQAIYLSTLVGRSQQ